MSLNQPAASRLPVDAFACNAAALLFGLSEESRDPTAVRRRAKQLQEQVDALALGSEMPA